MDARVSEVSVPASFSASPGQFFGLILGGSLLQIPTFGFYRFWLLTDIRRHFWSNTRIGRDSFEYTGLPSELLIGFLIALAILAPVYFVYFLIGLEAERLQAFASVPLLLFMYVLAQYAWFRARRYRATRTIFRGLRLWMTGSAWKYAGRALLWDALTVLTLGLAYPWRAAALEEYRMRHTHYGDLQGAFVGSGWTFFKRGWWLWLLSVLIVGGIPLVIATMMATGRRLPLALARADLGISLVPFLLIVILALFVWPLFRAIQLHWRLEGIRFGDVTVKSSLTKSSVFWCYLKAWLVGVVFVTLISIAAGLASVAFEITVSQLANAQSPLLIGSLVLFYLFVLLGFGIIKLQFLDRGIWAAAVNSVTIFNMAGLDGVVSRGAAAGSLGEGLSDALDFGAGL